MLKRIELHNHSLESDGRMSVPELVSWLVSSRITAFSLTDHNTVSGLPVLEKLREEDPVFEYLNGYELTSWYGHILCQNVSGYIPWDDCDRENGDALFDRVHAQGGLAGIAHPVSFPHPLSNGLRFEFLIHDWSKVDFIEIINNSHPAFPDNGKGIRYWEDRFLKGYTQGVCPAPVSGMDLHAPTDMSRTHTTWMELDDSLLSAPLHVQLDAAVKQNRTIVSNGPVLLYERKGDLLSLQTDLKTDERIQGMPEETPFLLSLRSPSASYFRRLQGHADLSLSACGIGSSEPIVLKLYPGYARPEETERLLPSCIRACLPQAQSIR